MAGSESRVKARPIFTMGDPGECDNHVKIMPWKVNAILDGQDVSIK